MHVKRLYKAVRLRRWCKALRAVGFGRLALDIKKLFLHVPRDSFRNKVPATKPRVPATDNKAESAGNRQQSRECRQQSRECRHFLEA